MKTSYLLLLGSILSLTAISCDERPEITPTPVPAPEASYTLGRSFYYPATTAFRGISYPTPDLRGAAHQDQTGLHLHFTTTDRREDLSLDIDASALPPDLLGTYQLRSTTNRLHPATANYGFNFLVTDTGTAGSFYGSNFSELDGHVRITAYDAARRLISGSYEVRLPDVSDPTDSVRVRANQMRCRVTLGGNFANLPLAQ